MTLPPGFKKTEIICPVCGRRFVARNGDKIICMNTECCAVLSPKPKKVISNQITKPL